MGAGIAAFLLCLVWISAAGAEWRDEIDIPGTDPNPQTATEKNPAEKSAKTGIPDEEGNVATIPWMGVLIKDSYYGVLVTVVYEGTPAHAVGMQRGDILMAINGRRVSSMRDAARTIQSRRIGDTVEVLVASGQQVHSYQLQLAAKPVVLGR